VHIGGCHFASSIAVAGRRERYGRLEPRDVPAFLAALTRGETYLPAFRGRADLDEPEQVAELAAMRWAAKSGQPEQDVLLDAASEAGRKRYYTANIAGARLTITLEARDFTIYPGCEEANRGIPALTKRWLVREVAAAEQNC
jgi:hypothetical protein